MLYEFKIAPSMNQGEPTQDYFDGLQYHAMDVERATQAPTAAQAFQVCEYLDAVDSRALASTPALYQCCLSKLMVYLTMNSKAEVARLGGRSWAANTCVELIKDSLVRAPCALVA